MPSVPSKRIPGTQNMKTETDALGTTENDFGRAKHENGTRRTQHRRQRVRERKTWKQDKTPSVPSKMSAGAQNMKMGPNELDTVENDKTWIRDLTPSETPTTCAKHENGTRRPRYRRKWQNMNKRLDALGIAEN
jgi:hypothetical protein